MKKKYYFGIFIFLNTLIACTNGNTANHNKNEMVADTLSVQTINEVETYCPSTLHVADDRLVIINNCLDQQLQIINPENYATQFELLKGEGPDEYLNITCFNQRDNIDGIEYIRLIDSHKKNTFLYAPGHNTIQQKDRIPFQALIYMDLLYLGSGRWAYTPLDTPDYLNFVYKDKTEKTAAHYPDLQITCPPKFFNYAYYSKTQYNEHHQKLVSAFRYFPAIVIRNKEGKVTNVAMKDDFKKPQFKDAPFPVNNPKFYYNDLITSSKYIYAVNYNVDFDAFQKDETTIKAQLEIYDWDLNPVKTFVFDNVFANIAIDFKRNRIYGFCTENPEHALSYVDIPEQYQDLFSL